MISTFTAAAATSPTFMSQYGPLIAALIALFAAMTTLVVSGRRDERRYRAASEDEYRREQRVAVAAIAAAAQDFRRTASSFGDPGWLAAGGFDAASLGLQVQAEDASAALLSALTVARLLVHDVALQVAIDSVYARWAESERFLLAVVAAFRERRSVAVSAAAGELEGGWLAFDESAATLHSVALARLAPSAVDRARRR